MKRFIPRTGGFSLHLAKLFLAALITISANSQKLATPTVAQSFVSRYSVSSQVTTPFPTNWTVGSRSLPEASEQSFIFRPWRQTNFTINVTIPVAALVIPNRGLFDPTTDVTNQAIFLVFGALVLTAMFAVPLLFTGTRPFSDDDGNIIPTDKKIKRILGSSRNFNYMDADLQNLIGINPEICLQKTICEAHRYPHRYLVLSMPFRLFFPPALNTSSSKHSPFRQAAREGQNGTTLCSEKYNCFFDVLDVTLYFIDWWRDATQQEPLPIVREVDKNSIVASKKKKSFKDPTFEPESYRYIPNYPAPNAFLERRIFNVSVPTFTPMFDFKIPDMGPKGSPLELTNQLIIGAFAVLTYLAAIAEPILVAGARPTALTARDGDNDGFFTKLMRPNKVFYFQGKNITTHIGIDSEKCLQKSICEAHRYPDSYGLVSLALRMFYPPASSSILESLLTPNQRAAKNGQLSKQECKQLYDCFFDPLDLALFVTNWWKNSRDPDQYPLLF